ISSSRAIHRDPQIARQQMGGLTMTAHGYAIATILRAASSRSRVLLVGRLRWRRPVSMGLVALAFLSVNPARQGSAKPLFLPAQGSTSPENGDLNPYGLAVVPSGFPSGALRPGQLLVSNFNNSAADGNVQGEGSTIVTMDPGTAQQLGVFFQGTAPIGFTNALGIVKEGFVFAGSVFTTPANSAGQNGGLLVIDHLGHLVTTIMTGTNGPWGLAIKGQDNGALLFVSNVLDGTVTRIEVSFKGGFNT